MKQANRQPKAFAYTNLISCCARLASKHAGRRHLFVADAEQRFEELLATDAGGVTIEAVNAMVFAYRAGHTGNSGRAVDLVETALREWKLVPDTSTIATLVVCLLKDGNALEASRWIEYALQHRVYVEDAIVRDVVDACRRGAHWHKVETLQTMLQEHGVAQRDRALKQVLQKSRFRDATPQKTIPTVLQSSIQATDGDTNASVVLSKKEQKKTAMENLRRVTQAIASGMQPLQPVTKDEWTTVFEYGPIQQIDQLMRTLAQAPPQQLTETTTGVKIAWLNQMYLRALGAAGQWWRVMGTLDTMLHKAPRSVDIYGFNAAIRCCTRSGRLHDALCVVERMETHRVRLNRESYDALMQCCASVGSVESALRFFYEMERNGLTPTVRDLNATLKAFATAVQRLMEASSRHDDTDNDVSQLLDVPASDLSKLAVHALQFFEDVTTKHRGLDISETTVFSLFRSFLGAAEVFDAVDLREFEIFSRNADVLGHHRGGGDDEIDDDLHGHAMRESQAEWLRLSSAVQRICRDAPAHVVTPRVVNVAIDFFQRRSEPDSAFELFNTMISRRIPPTSDTIRLLFAACYTHSSGNDDANDSNAELKDGDADPQLGLFFLEHLLATLSDDDAVQDTPPDLRRVIAREALRWAGKMDRNSSSSIAGGSSTLVDVVFEKLVSSGVVAVEASMFAELMGVYALEGDLVQAQRLAQRMVTETGTMTLEVGNRLLQTCSVARAPVFALDSLTWLSSHGVELDVVSYNNVLSSIRRRRAGVERQRVADDEEEEDVENVDDESDQDDGDYEQHVASDDLRGAEAGGDEQESVEAKEAARGGRLGQLEANLSFVVDELLADMAHTGVLVDARTFECVSAIASQRGELERVVQVFDLITKSAGERHVELSELLTERTLLCYLDACTGLASTCSTTDPLVIAKRLDDVKGHLETWRRERGYKVTSAVLQRLVYGYDAVNQWRTTVEILKNASNVYGVTPGVGMLQAVMEICNRAEQHKVAEQIFVTMQKQQTSHDGRVYTSAACYVEAIYAFEQQANWIQATQLFMEMQKLCPAEELHPSLLNRIALGRYAQGRQRPD